MSMRISIDLDEDDLKHFRLIMREARKSAGRARTDEIIAAAEDILAGVSRRKVPTFVNERLEKLEIMIDMLTDHEWRLPQNDVVRVLNALAYLCDPEDLIPDHIPGLGFLDDAIMIELVVRDLRHEMDAYADFCAYRKSGQRRKGIKLKSTDMDREAWLEVRRKRLQARMRRRRASEVAGGKSPKVL